jgi:hypothetical protein
LIVPGASVRGEVTVTLVDAVRLLPSAAFAVTVHTVLLRGAVNSPALGSTVPQLVTQVAAALAVNCRVEFSRMLGLAGTIVK